MSHPDRKRRGACRHGVAVGIFLCLLAGGLGAESGGEAVGPTSPEVSADRGPAGLLDRLRIGLGGGLFLPFGPWSDGFDPGIVLAAGVDFPAYPALEIGGRVSRVETRMDDQAALSWISMVGQAIYYPPSNSPVWEPYLVARGGVLRGEVEVGRGREAEWDVVAGLGGGIRFPTSDRSAFRLGMVWERVLAEGGGLSLLGELQFGLP